MDYKINKNFEDFDFALKALVAEFKVKHNISANFHVIVIHVS